MRHAETLSDLGKHERLFALEVIVLTYLELDDLSIQMAAGPGDHSGTAYLVVEASQHVFQPLHKLCVLLVVQRDDCVPDLRFQYAAVVALKGAVQGLQHAPELCVLSLVVPGVLEVGHRARHVLVLDVGVVHQSRGPEVKGSSKRLEAGPELHILDQLLDRRGLN